MKNKSRYVFGAAMAGIAFGGIPGLVHQAKGALITNAAFTFETPESIFPSTSIGTASTGSNSGTNSSTFYNYASVTASQIGPLSADSGTGSAYGVHMFTASSGAGSLPSNSVWSTPVGNGSQRALSANHWGLGDYYEFDVTTAGIMGILINFDQTSSSTGPKAFALTYTVGAVSGTAGAYTVGTTSFAAASSNTAVSFGFNLSTITALDNAGPVTFRLVDADTTTATGGTDRIDNFTVSGSAAAVPEPMGLSLLTVASAAALFRGRKKA